MTDKQLTVGDDVVVSLDYILRLDDGKIVSTSTTEDGEPLEFLQGRGRVISGVEQELYGMSVGDEKDLVVPAAEGYGDRDPEAVQLVPHHVLRVDSPLQPGMRLHLQDETGHTFEAHVAEVRPEGVLLDFNHPLAGERLHFWVKIADLRRPTEEELAHGHVHSGQHRH
jgi:FKBP-type peptidyl-prolyl cis-trans isomerase SlyD